MSKTIEYAGREWCHQQFYGLMTKLIEDDMSLLFGDEAGHFKCLLTGKKGTIFCYGKGPTLWLALVGAVEKKEAE